MKTLDNARQEASDLLRLDLAGTKGANLGQADFFRLESAMADIVLAIPGDYDPAVVEWARRHVTGPNYRRGPETLSLREAAAIFVGEFTAQAERINPFSQQNRATTRNFTIGAILLAAVTFAAVLAYRTAPART